MKQITQHHTILIVVATLVLFTNLGATPLWDRDEPRNAGCAMEMLERGDWVVPIFNDQLRDAKPVLLYWLIMSAYAVFGVNEFAARFWSAALAIGTVLATYHIGRRLFNPHAALWSAIILTTSLMFGVAGRAATPDSLLIFCGTMALMVYVLGTFQEGGSPRLINPGHYFPQHWPTCALMFGFMGLGILAKGPVGLVLPTAIIGMFLLIKRLPQTSGPSKWYHVFRTFGPLHFLKTCCYMRPLTAIVVAGLIAAPWFILVGLRTDGDYLAGFFLKEHFGRATTAMENHSGGPWFYPFAIMVGFFPWSVFTIPVMIWFYRSQRVKHEWSDGYTFLACWVCVYVGIFTIASTKLPSYVTPCYPALALLTGCFIHRWSESPVNVSAIWTRISTAVLGIVGVAMLVGIPLAANRYLPGEQWLESIGAILVVGAMIAALFIRLQQSDRTTLAFGATAIAFAIFMFGFATVQIGRHQQNQILFNEIDRRADHAEIGSFGCLESTWVFYAKRPILELSPRSDETTPITTRKENWHRHPSVDVATFLAKPKAFVVTTEKHLESIRDEIPHDVKVLAKAKYFLKKDNLVLLGRPEIAQTANRPGSADRR